VMSLVTGLMGPSSSDGCDDDIGKTLPITSRHRAKTKLSVSNCHGNPLLYSCASFGFPLTFQGMHCI
jgi:hypothetical protein